jgi:hypothetical protein
MKKLRKNKNPNDIAQAVWLAHLDEAKKNPHLASILMMRCFLILRRFKYFYKGLRALPRRTRRLLQYKLATTLAGTALMLALSGTPTNAGTINVDGVTCTLADAITAANTDTATVGCGAGSGADTIVLEAGSTHNEPLPEITSEITINGNGATITGVPNSYILEVVSSGDLMLNDVTITGPGDQVHNTYGQMTLNNCNITGTSVYNYYGQLTLNDCTISGNTSSGINSSGGITTINNSTITVTDSIYTYSYTDAHVMRINNSTISGNGTSGVWAQANFDFRYLYPQGNNTLEINNSIISGNGSVQGDGGLFIGSGRVKIQGSTISDNNSKTFGGGVYSYNAEVTIIDSTISGNNTIGVSTGRGEHGSGGGVYSNFNSYLKIIGSTVTNNTASNSGGGLYVQCPLLISNSTISGNSAGNGGGGIDIYNTTATIQNSTITGNSASNSGGGIITYYSIFNLHQSLISGNTAPKGREVYLYGADYDGDHQNDFNADDFNLFGLNNDAGVQYINPNSSSNVYSFTPGSTDIVPGAGVQVSDILDTTLANNGGNTMTHALVTGSPAVDAIPSSLCGVATDQRGVSRPKGAGCDIGAFELEEVTNTPPFAEAGNNETIDSSQQSSTILNGTASDSDGDDLTYRWLEGTIELLSSRPVVGGLAPLDLSLLSSPLGIGAHTLTLEVDDGQAKSTDEMILTIENSPPIVAPSGGGTFQLGDDITLSGQVADFDGDILNYSWKEGANVFITNSITTIGGGDPVDLVDHVIIGGLPLGNHVITLEANDGTNDPVSGNISVDVVDTSSPTISATVNPGILWPPNHKMVDVTIQVNANDNSGSVNLSATVESSEPPDTDGDGNTIPDFTEPVIDQDTGVIALQLRAERQGQGTGRTYTITVTATDDSGNSSDAIVVVVAPHDKGKK